MKIHKKRFSEEIAQAVKHKITELGLQEGERLPSHANLARELNVSIPSLREGLQLLTTLGVLKISHGVGTIVAQPKVSDYFRILNSVLRSKPYIREECLEVRRLLEPFIASRVAGKGGSYPRLKESLGIMTAAAGDDDFDTFMDEDLRFHRRLDRLAGNSVITEILNIVGRLLFSEPEIQENIKRNMRTIIRHHQDLVDALEQQDTKKAEKTMIEHLSLIDQPARMSIILCVGQCPRPTSIKVPTILRTWL